MDPFDIAMDKSGNLYVADRLNNRVRKFTAGGNIVTVAGTGSAGFSGDNGPAASATLDHPTGVAIDSAGNLYIADAGNAVLRKVTADGIIHTIAGDGVPYPFNGDGPALLQNVHPFRVAVDSSGIVYISDWANDRIRKLTPVTAASVGIISGNNQAGIAGNPLAQPLTVKVVATDNSPYAGATVTFAVAGGSASLTPSTPQQTLADGTASVFVKLGSTAGPVTITATVAGLNPVTFSLTANPAPMNAASLGVVSGDKQTGTAGTTLPGKLVVKVSSSDGTPFPGATVTFAVTSGTATLNPATQQTAADGTASTSVTLGPNTGAVTVSAAVTGLPTVTFSLTATAPPNLPQIYTGGVVSAGLSKPAIQIASANAILSIFGQNFASAGSNFKVSGSDLVNGLVPTNFGGVCVTFGGQRAPIFLVTPGQLNVQAPQLPPSGPVDVQVIANCDTPQQSVSNTVAVAAQAAAPEFFYSSSSANGKNPIAAIDGLTNGGVGDPARLGQGFAMAYPGEIVQIYATGLGLTNPPFSPGQLPPSAASVAGVSVSIDGNALDPAAIQYAGVAPLNAGLYQLNIVLPVLSAGDHEISLAINGVSSPAGSYISVGP